jgi:hypothetical protein
MISQDGECKCHTCAHSWKDDSFKAADGGSSDLSSTAAFLVDPSDEEFPYNPGKSLTSEGLGVHPKEENPMHIGDDEENPTWSTDWINELEEKYPQIANMSDAKRHEFLEKRGLGDVPTGDLLEKKYVPEDIGKAASLDSFVEPEEEELEIDDSTHEWLDENNEPLEEGKEYEIYAHDYDIPDVGRVVEIKPDAIVYEIESDGGLRTTIEIDRQEADLNGYRFVESGIGSSSENHPGIEENMDSKPVPEPGQTTDLSTPHIQIGSKVAGKHYTPMEQRELIDEYGEARNSDKLKLNGTHYAEANDDYFLFGC